MPSRFWCDNSLFVSVEGPDISETFTIEKPYARVGSHEASDVVLTGDTIVKRLLYLHVTDAGIYCLGLHHRSPAEPRLSSWLQPDDSVQAGPYRISARISQQKADIQGQHDNLDAPFQEGTPYPVIDVLVRGRSIGVIRPQRRLLVLGRRFPSHVLILDELLSATHCVLYWDSSRLWIVDLLSAGGSWKRDQRIQAAFLREGESIHVGRVELRFSSVSTTPIPLDEESSTGSLPDTGALEETATSMSLDDVDISEIANEYGNQDQVFQDSGFIANEVLPKNNDQASRPDDRQEAVERVLEILARDKQALELERENWLAEQRTVYERLDQRENALQKTLADLQSKQEDANRQIQADRTSLEALRNELNEQRQQIEQRSEALAQQAESFRQERDAWEADRKKAESHLQERNQELEQSVAKMSARQQELEAESQRLAEINELVDQERAEMDQLRARLENRETELTERMQESQQATKRETAADERLAEERHELEQIQAAIRNQEAAQTKRAKALQADFHRLTAQGRQLEKERAELEQLRATLENQDAELKQRADTSQTESTRQAARAEQLEKERAEIEQFRAALETREYELTRWAEQMRAEADQREQQIKEDPQPVDSPENADTTTPKTGPPAPHSSGGPASEQTDAERDQQRERLLAWQTKKKRPFFW